MSDFPVIMTSSGAQPQGPSTINTKLINTVAADQPGYTANLPGILVEDISSTETFGITLCDQARVDAVNSISPLGANEFVLTQQGAAMGLLRGTTTNATVEVRFSGTAGYVIPQGFIVSDGSYQYKLSSGGVIQTSGVSALLSAISTSAGTWSIPAGTVNKLVTTLPTGVSLTVTNPLAGTPGGDEESWEAYRSRILAAQLASSMGMASYLKTLLKNVSGVTSRLVSVRQNSNGWEVICGGGDNYDVAYAIFMSVPDVAALTGSVISVTGITAANPGVVTTDLNHGYSTGDSVTISGVSPSAYNATYTVTVISEKTFSIGVNTSSYGAYVSGGTTTPNDRNVVVSLNDYPDVYTITYVDPPEQTVTIVATWNTTLTDFVGAAAVAQLAAPALISYINSIEVGAPINLLQMTTTFQTAVETVIATSSITRLVFSVDINGVSTSPASGESYISGDPESYFFASSSAVTVTQG